MEEISKELTKSILKGDITDVGKIREVENLMKNLLQLKNLDGKMVQYFRVRRKFIIDKETERPVLVERGVKKGVFLAYPDVTDDSKIAIGFSLCHRRDRFDFKNRMKMPGLGIWYAFGKAEKYRNSDRVVISSDKNAKQLPRDIVKVPQSMVEDMQKFIRRCRKFYKGKELPKWTVNLSFANAKQEPLFIE
jgi:hypothetical protein